MVFGGVISTADSYCDCVGSVATMVSRSMGFLDPLCGVVLPRSTRPTLCPSDAIVRIDFVSASSVIVLPLGSSGSWFLMIN